MWWRALLVGGFLAGLVGACAMVDPVDQRYDTVSRSLAKARDESIFLNIVRASHDYPLSFATIANVTPTMTNTSSFALPSFSIGPPNCLRAAVAPPNNIACSYATGVPGAAAALGSSTASNSTAIGTNFNVSTQETGSFYNGFLKPIDLQTLDYFIRQGYPRELLFWLFADSFELTSPGHPALGYQYDPPKSYGCPKGDPLKLCFREWVWVAVLAGLTVEEKTIQKPESGGGGRNSENRASSPSGGTSRSTRTETIVVARFCFSDVLRSEAEVQMGRKLAAKLRAQYMAFPFQPSPKCGGWTPAEAIAQSMKPQGDTFDFNVGPLKFRVVSRSAYGAFEFLGNIMKNQREQSPPGPDAVYYPPFDDLPPETDIPPKILTTGSEPLIDVVQGAGGDCFSHTWFYDGDYCVPQSATNTKRIFSLLSQLMAIETAATDLSITPIVRVIQ